MAVMKETRLYPPLKTWLEAQGYTVRGEVGRCDLAAEKDGHLIAIELKIRPSMALLAQAAERQEYADSVYVALPATPDRPRPPSSRNLRRLLIRLGIGLILITFKKKKTNIEVLIHPGTGTLPHRPKKKTAIIREISGREMDLSPGGLPGGKPRISAYRQRAIRLAAWLSGMEQASPAQLRKLGAPEDTGSILSQNLYGWFERIQRGVYRLHEAGRTALNDVPELKEYYIEEYERKLSGSGQPGSVTADRGTPQKKERGRHKMSAPSPWRDI